MESWFAAAMPSLAGAAGLRYRRFIIRMLAMRVPWLAAALGAGALAATSIAHLGHVIGLAGIIVTGFVVVALLVFRWRAGLGRSASSLPRALSSTML